MLSPNLNRFLKASYRYREDFLSLKTDPSTATREDAYFAQIIIVRFQDSWGQFVRGLVVSSSSGLAQTISGRQISSGLSFHGTAQVENWLLQNRGTNREPDWHVSDVALRYANRLRPSNFSDISSAIGSVNSPEKAMRDYRNFVVHRNKSTADRVRINPELRAFSANELQMLPFAWSTGGIAVFEDWLRRFELVARVASS